MAGRVDMSIDKIKSAWEAQPHIDRDIWDNALNGIKSCSINSRQQLIQLKVLHRLHYAKVPLRNIFPELLPLCDRCSWAEGNLAHHFLDMSRLLLFHIPLVPWCV